MMLVINFTGYALCKINKENYQKWGTTACEIMVIPATLMGVCPMLDNCPHTPLMSKATNGITPTTKMNFLDPICLRLEQSRESNPNAGKMDQT